jgi:hypothetical protein
MEDEYVTSDPAIFTVAAVLIFVFTSLVFLLYDRLVESSEEGHVDCGAVFSYRFVALPCKFATVSFQQMGRTRRLQTS